MRRPKFENGVKKGLWSAEEDKRLIATLTCLLKRSDGIWNWTEIPKYAGLFRNGKSCRLRWVNYLCPTVKCGNMTKEEEDIIISIHQTLGNKWSAIALELPGRTDNEVKNHWHGHLKKRVENINKNINTKKTNAPVISSNSELGSCSTSESIPSSSTTTTTVEEQKIEVDIMVDDLQSLWEGLPSLHVNLDLQDDERADLQVPHDEPLSPYTLNLFHAIFNMTSHQPNMDDDDGGIIPEIPNTCLL